MLFFSVMEQQYFKDKYVFYRFIINDEWKSKNADEKSMEKQLQETIELLTKIAPDATLRMILRKP